MTLEYLEAYFGLPVKFYDPIPIFVIPDYARRIHPMTKDRQILTSYVLEEVLKPKIPEDAFCFIAFTTSDLWPGAGWNFVFGQASDEDRIGVWSIYRNGDPNESQEAFNLCLKRTIKTGTHEIGHMFSIWHCIAFECNMNGSNHRKESDQRPLWLCPICLKKLCWIIGLDPIERYRKVVEFAQKHELNKECVFFWQSIELLSSSP